MMFHAISRVFLSPPPCPMLSLIYFNDDQRLLGLCWPFPPGRRAQQEDKFGRGSLRERLSAGGPEEASGAAAVAECSRTLRQLDRLVLILGLTCRAAVGALT
ncbi:unnamed protein product [Prorocentrum cordatum]|uniref:Anaphase-promoting complex subunit 1 n=1 Tax=Prorocentrum cordatum TaxID=2364126 RepID=A0ABN9W3G5_9DINO|nr:unnamed protein product [Polarella glacialis]